MNKTAKLHKETWGQSSHTDDTTLILKMGRSQTYKQDPVIS